MVSRSAKTRSLPVEGHVRQSPTASVLPVYLGCVLRIGPSRGLALTSVAHRPDTQDGDGAGTCLSSPLLGAEGTGYPNKVISGLPHLCKTQHVGGSRP